MTAILTYHNLGDPPPGVRNPDLYVSAAAFAAQLLWLKDNGFQFLDLDALRSSLLGETSAPRRSVVLTFDDGFADNHSIGLPLLVRHAAVATFFPIARSIGGKDDLGRDYLSAAQLCELAAAGMQIGSHTAGHALLARIPPEAARSELADSRAILENILEAPVRWLCYPRGNFNRDVARLAEETGYRGACSAIRGNRPAARQLFWLPRVMIHRDTPASRLRWMLGAGYELTHRFKNRSRWKEFL
jgi:peptidoglycan/xylan/chitin deacetylase (PgdA/CDA1 family)